MSRETKQDLIDQLGEQFRISGNQENAFDNAAAQRLGVNRTDLNALDILERAGPLTAGELAKQMGLTTGAVTAVIDRLEQKGFAGRVRDPDDRRRVMVEVSKEFHEAAWPIWQPVWQEWQELMRSYSADELRTVLAFMRAANEVGLRNLERALDEL